MYLIVDIESNTDRQRLLRTYPWRGRFNGTEDEVMRQILEEICKVVLKDPLAPPTVDCFIPARYQSPNTIVALLVDRQMEYQGHWILDQRTPGGTPDVKAITEAFWSLVTWGIRDRGAAAVTFNGLGFDFPLMEVCGLEHGTDMRVWFPEENRFWTDPRGVGATKVHIDLYSHLAGKTKVGGSLDWWAKLAGLPGKLDSHGDDVKSMLERVGGGAEIADYCTCDVLNTYGLLYRTLWNQRLVAQDWRGATFDRTMTAMAAGRGKEVTRFIEQINPST
jgi:hypothetical protein